MCVSLVGVVIQDNGNKRLAPLVHPPRLDGAKKGIFATRTPHRPNPIGLSLCKLEAIEGKVVKLSGVDMIHGTPILDIKPFIPDYDGEADAACLRVAEWISRPPVPELHVAFSPTAEVQLEALLPTFKHLREAWQVRQAIADVLHSDPRRWPCALAPPRALPLASTAIVGVSICKTGNVKGRGGGEGHALGVARGAREAVRRRGCKARGV